jgi:NTE family protein
MATLLERLPDELRDLPEVVLLAAEANKKVCNVVHLIYRAKKYEGCAKDYEFSRRTMEEHWLAGYSDAVQSLSHREIFEPPDRLEGVRTFDFTATRNNPYQLVPISEDQTDERA